MRGGYSAIVADPPWAYAEGWPASSTSPKAVTRSFPAPSSERKPLPYNIKSEKVDAS